MFQRIAEFGKGTFFYRMPFQKLIEIRSIPHRLLTQEQTNSTAVLPGTSISTLLLKLL
jgi:hypothetical protein